MERQIGGGRREGLREQERMEDLSERKDREGEERVMKTERRETGLNSLIASPSSQKPLQFQPTLCFQEVP